MGTRGAGLQGAAVPSLRPVRSPPGRAPAWGEPVTHPRARRAREERGSHLALGNLSGLVQARRKLKNFPSKTLTSRRDKEQLRVINPCQHPGPEVRLEPGGDQRAARPPEVRNALATGIPSPQAPRSQGPKGTRRPPPHPMRPQAMAGRPWRGAAGALAAQPRPAFCSGVSLGAPLGPVQQREASHQGSRCKQLAAPFSKLRT